MTIQTKSNLLLLLTAFIWGSAFVAQKVGLDYVGPYTFNCLRFIIGAIVLIPIIWLLDRKQSDSTETFAQKKKLPLFGGFCCGVVIFAASTLQQLGLMYTDAGKAGFITALYIVLVPVLGLFSGKRVSPIIWLCVAIAVVGLYLLCAPAEGLSFADINKGDLLMVLSAFMFAAHILVIDHFSPKSDGAKLSCIQFAVCGIIATVPMFIFEEPALGEIFEGWLPLLYVGVLSCGVAYTLQIIAQKNTEPTTASLIMSTESVFSVFTAIILLHESLTLREALGCVVMFVAIILAQLPRGKRENLNEQTEQACEHIG